MMPTIKRIYDTHPTSDQIRKFIKYADQDYPDLLVERSYDHRMYNSVNDVVRLIPENDTFEKVFAKVHLINSVYSTRILNVHSAAKQLYETFLNIGFDERINKGEPQLVDDIKNVVLQEKDYSFTSFASKYCHCHQPTLYPIYDSYALYGLKSFFQNNRLEILQDSKSKLISNPTDYTTYVQLFDAVNNWINGSEKLTRRELDRYLWLVGRAYFTEISCTNSKHLNKKGEPAKVKIGSAPLLTIQQRDFKIKCPECGTVLKGPLTDPIRMLGYFGREN